MPGAEATAETTARRRGEFQAFRRDRASTATPRVCAGGKHLLRSSGGGVPIEKHFDIQRNYNSATGEQGNVIPENSPTAPGTSANTSA